MISELAERNQGRLYRAWNVLRGAEDRLHVFVLDGASRQELKEVTEQVQAALCELRTLEQILNGLAEPKIGP